MLNADTPDPRSRHILAATPQHPSINHVELSIRAPSTEFAAASIGQVHRGHVPVGEQTTAFVCFRGGEEKVRPVGDSNNSGGGPCIYLCT